MGWPIYNQMPASDKHVEDKLELLGGAKADKTSFRNVCTSLTQSLASGNIADSAILRLFYSPNFL